MESDEEDADNGIAGPGKRVEVVTAQIRAYYARRHCAGREGWPLSAELGRGLYRTEDINWKRGPTALGH